MTLIMGIRLIDFLNRGMNTDDPLHTPIGNPGVTGISPECASMRTEDLINEIADFIRANATLVEGQLLHLTCRVIDGDATYDRVRQSLCWLRDYQGNLLNYERT